MLFDDCTFLKTSYLALQETCWSHLMPSCGHPWLAGAVCWLTTIYVITVLQAGGSSALLMDLAANEKSVHAEFLNGK